jgi:uncharacterized membrane protein
MIIEDYFFHMETKSVYRLLDEDACRMWADRHNTEADIFFPVYGLTEKKTYIIPVEEFERIFVGIEEGNFDDVCNIYKVDDLDWQRMKREILSDQ